MDLAVRHYAATTPNLIPADFVASVLMSGGFHSYVLNQGHNVFTQRGEEAANFLYSLYSFSLERCALGLGEQVFNPFPANGDPNHEFVDGQLPQQQPPAFQPPPQEQQQQQPPLPQQQPPPQQPPYGVPEGHVPLPLGPNPNAVHVPPHLLGQNIGIVLPNPVPPQPNGAGGEEDDDIIYLD
jgi:hypothetical protein